MLIDFDMITETIVPRFYDGEKDTVAHMFADELNRIMLGKLEPGSSIGLHKHEAGSEIVYVLRGNGIAIYDYAEEKLEPGFCHYCPKGHRHSLVNTGNDDLVFFAVVPQQ